MPTVKLPVHADVSQSPAVRVSPVSAVAAPPGAGAGAAIPAQDRILRRGAQTGRLTHVQEIPARPGRRAAWPPWVPPDLAGALARSGAERPWAHQARAARLARSGRSVIKIGRASCRERV